MGTDHSIADHTNNFDPYEWQQISHTNDTRILTNRHNHNNIIQQHTIAISDDKQLQLAQQLYQFRINDNQLVSTKYFNLEKQQQMCSKSYAGHLYTENIPIRLSNIVHVPFPDILHIYNQALNGFHRLSRRLGYFKVNQDCIGVNNQHVAKVWHSPNFSQIQPHFRAQSEQDMVYNIVSIIQSNTDSNSMPRQQPSFSKFLYQDTQRAGFGEAKRKLQLYANYFNRGVIPRYLNCVEKAGGAQSIRSKWEQTNGTFSNYVNGYSNTYQNGYNNVSYRHREEAVIGQAVVPNIVNTTVNTNANNNTITNTNYSVDNKNSNVVNNQTTIQRNYGPAVIENTTNRYIPSIPLQQVNSTYTYQNNSGYIPANNTQLNQVQPRLASSSSQNFYKTQTFAPRAQSKIQTTQILQPVAQRSAVFYSPPSVVMANKPPSIISSRILASNQPKNIYTTYRNQSAYTKPVSQLPVRRVATQPVQNVQIITNAYNPIVQRSRFASPVVNQSTVRNVVIQENRPQVISNGNTVVNQVPTIQVTNNNVTLNTVPSQNQIKTQQQIQVNSQIIPSQKKVVSTSSIPIVPTNTQVTISQRQPSQATIISNPNQIVVGPPAPVSNSLIPIKVASNQSINITQNTPLISNSQYKEQLSRQNISSPNQNTTVQPINVVNNVISTSQNKINTISQPQIAPYFSSQASVLSPNKPLTQVQQVLRTTPQNQQFQQARTQISLVSPTINNTVLPQQTSNTQIQGSQPWARDTLNWQYQPKFQPPSQVQQIQQIQQIHTINSPSQQKSINNFQPSPIQSPIQQKSTNFVPQYIENSQQSKYGSASRQYTKTEGIRQIQLNQANSVSSRYRTDQSPSYSPQRVGASQNYSTRQDFDLVGQIKTPTQSSVPVNESISTIQAKQSKFGDDKGFSQIKQESINTSTRNFYNNYQDYSSNSNIDWQNPVSDDYSSARFNKDKDNYQYGDTYKTYTYQNQYKKYEYNPSNDYDFGKQTGQFVRNEKTGLIQQNNGNAGNSAYSFGSNNYYYDYNTGYSNGDTYQKKIITSSKQEQNNGPPSFMNKYNENQYIPNYSFESKKQYQEYNNGELTSGYRIAQTGNNFDYQIKSQDLVTGKQKSSPTKITSFTSNHFNSKELKQSMVDDDPYSVQWDPEILADLQANVHSKSEI